MKDENSVLKAIPERLLAWYDRCARKLPWRENRDPYRIWISEIMLQQTRVEAVKEYYTRFLAAFPDVFSLANAPEEQVLKLWEGLGYYSRARNLQKAARVVAEECEGRFPRSAAELSRLPGIGSYTAGAISSIAFDCREAAVDGNVLRVAARLLASGDNVSRQAVKNEVAEQIRAVIPERAGDFNQSLMELGATVCLPNGEPLCGECPLAEVCEGRKQGIAAELPVKIQKKERTAEQKTVFILLWNGYAAFRKRPEKGLLAGMWEFPNIPGALTREQAIRQLEEWGLALLDLSQTAPAKHIFTHREWHMSGWLAHVEPRGSAADFLWAGREQTERELTVPSAFAAFTKILRREWDNAPRRE